MRSRIGIVAVLLIAQENLAADRVGGSMTVVNDYVFRGISQTYSRAAIQADLHYADPRGFSAGLWASTIELNPWEGRTGEVNAYAAYRLSLDENWAAKIAAVHYDYPWNDRFDYDYDEVVGSLSFRDLLFFNVAWSFDASRYATRVSATTGNTIAYDAVLALPMAHSLSANLGAGYYDLHSVVRTGYAYWNVGLGYDRSPFRFDVNYIGTSTAAERLFYSDVAGTRVAASLSWRF